MRSDQHSKIKKWICTDDPGDTHEYILAKTEVSGKYQNCGQWFIERPEFQAWSANDLEADPKRPIWLRGTGT